MTEWFFDVIIVLNGSKQYSNIGDKNMRKKQKTNCESTAKADRAIEEYKYLREEVIKKIELHTTILIFAITGTLMVLTIAFSEKITLLYLVPLFIIIPLTIRVGYHRCNMTKFSAYIIVFMEETKENEENTNGLKWETRNTKFMNRAPKNKNLFVTMHYYEYIFLSILCGALYVHGCLESFTDLCLFIFQMIAVGFLELCEIGVIYYIHRSAVTYKQEYINLWREIKAEENKKKIDEETKTKNMV